MSEIEEVVQIIKVTFDGVEVLFKVGDRQLDNMKDLVQLFANVIRREKLEGKTKMKNLLQKGGDLQVFQFPEEQKKEVLKMLKEYGILYSVLPDLNREDGFGEIIFHAEATPRINAMIERLNKEQVKEEKKVVDFTKESTNMKRQARIISLGEYFENADKKELQNERNEFEENQDAHIEQEERISPKEKEEIESRIHVITAEHNPTVEDITIDRKLIVKETDTAYLTRIPYEPDKFIWIDAVETVRINSGKTLLAVLQKDRDYEILNKEEKVVEKVKGETLYKENYDTVSLATKRRVQEELKKKQEVKKAYTRKKTPKRRGQKH